MAPRQHLPAGAPRRGFTLVEVLVALAVMALLAVLSWRGLDGMARAQAQTRERADQVLALQAGLAQWTADLENAVQLPQVAALDWDGRGLRLTREAGDEGLRVVCWTRRETATGAQWLRWQSPPLRGRGEWAAAWAQAAQWAQNPGALERRYEVAIAPLAQWQLFFFRGNAWTNPLSSAGAPAAPGPGAAPAGGDTGMPDGVRLILDLPAGQAIAGTLTRDWVRPTLGGGKS